MNREAKYYRKKGEEKVRRGAFIRRCHNAPGKSIRVPGSNSPTAVDSGRIKVVKTTGRH